jgi:putative transposase
VNRSRLNEEEARVNNSTENLNHTRWECKYHVVFIPKYRRKVMYASIRQELGSNIRELALQKESQVGEGHLMADHVHIMLSVPPKYSVSGVVGYIKGKSAIAIARKFMDRKKNFVGLNFWARGYYVSTVGRDEAQVRAYIKEQEKEDRRLDQLKMFE